MHCIHTLYHQEVLYHVGISAEYDQSVPNVLLSNLVTALTKVHTQPVIKL